MRADNLLPFGWLSKYEWAQKRYDLIPYMYPTKWADLPDEPGFQTEIGCVASGDFWLYDIGIAGVARIQDDQDPPQSFPSNCIPNIEVKLEIDGQYPLGDDFKPWPYLLGLNQRRGLGPGYILGDGGQLIMHLRTVLPWDTDVILAQRAQVVFIGCQLAKPGAATFGPRYYRNMLRSEWDKIVELRPYSYSEKADLDPMEQPNLIQISKRVRQRDFICTNISVFSESPEGNTNQIGPWNPLTNPPDVILSDEGGFWHSVSEYPAVGSMAAFSDGALLPVDFRIPRFIPRRREMTAFLGQYPWPPSEQRPPFKVGIIWNGYEIRSDRRAPDEIALPPSAHADPDYRRRRGAR